MKRSLADLVESDITTPSPPRFTDWSELISEMQDEVVSHLDCGTRECLALTSKTARARWHDKNFDNLHKRAKYLARDAPECYLTNYLRCMMYLLRATERDSFVKGIIQSSRLNYQYNGKSLHALFKAACVTNTCWKSLILITIKYGTVADYDLMASNNIPKKIPADEIEINTAFGAGNIPWILAMTDNPKSPLHAPKNLDYAKTQYMPTYFTKYLTSIKRKREVNWGLLFEHPTWKAWLEYQNNSPLCQSILLSHGAHGLRRSLNDPRAILNHLTLFKFFKPTHSMRGEGLYKESLKEYYIVLFIMGDIDSTRTFEALGFERPDRTDQWLSFDVIIQKVKWFPESPMLDWFASNGYLTLENYTRENVRVSVNRAPYITEDMLAWFQGHRLPDVRELGEFIKGIRPIGEFRS